MLKYVDYHIFPPLFMLTVVIGNSQNAADCHFDIQSKSAKHLQNHIILL